MAKKKSRKLLIGIVLVLIFGAGAYSVSVMSRPTTEIEASRLAKVERGDLARSVVAIGKIEPVSKVDIKSKANGIIKALNVDVDSLVRQGDVLVELDSQVERAQLMAGLQGAIEQLPEREKTVLSLYYVEEMNLREIGAIIGVSESRVSQILSKTALSLRTMLDR